jgi:hypothetical protein
MKFAMLLTALGIAGIRLLASPAAVPDAFPLNVYLNGVDWIPQIMLGPAEDTASKMLLEVGVKATWHHRLPRRGESRPETTMVVQIKYDPDSIRQGGAIASAQVFEGSSITLLYHRIKWAEGMPIVGPRVLAHVLVHEIAHNLQGVPRHSDTGVMKSSWTQSDYAEMSRRPLRFEPFDIDLIQLGLKQRRERLAAAGFTSARDL